MPLIAYSCNCKNLIKKFYRQAKIAPAYFLCEKCGLNMKKMLSAPSSSSIVVIDNGIQSKSVEINMEIIEANMERSTKNHKEE